MSFKLTKIMPSLFRGREGDVVTIDARALTPGASARVVGIYYDSATDQTAPFTLTVKTGTFGLGLIIEADQPATFVEIVEVDGADERHLAFHAWNPISKFSQITIKGI